jgi:predicted RNA-binding Zn-ribbon protein involved in translation (DUF1610 family)
VAFEAFDLGSNPGPRAIYRKYIMSYRNKPRRKRSPIWTIEKEKLVSLVKESSSIAELLRKLEIYTVGGNRNSLMKRLRQEQIDLSHIATGLDNNKGRKFGPSKFALLDEEVFIKNSQTSRAVVRKKVIKKNLISYNCAICGLKDFWNNKPIAFVLDHINGIPNDHRLENLRFLCPNCNSQTDTFCGRNHKNP